MGSVAQEVGSIPNAESYAFHTVSAFSLFFYMWESIGKPAVNVEMPEEDNVPSLEGCFTNDFLAFIAMQHQYLSLNIGNIYNTSKVIEGAYLELLGETMREKQHWALGPFNLVRIAEKNSSATRYYCLEWLDKQAMNSVVYVSFGTTTTLNDEQIKELAIGLRRSNQKFIWVLRDADKRDVFNGEVRSHELPKGYEDSVKDMGISMGVPIGTWPMHCDQPRNAVLITKLLKVGIAVKDWVHRDEIVTAPIIEDAVKRLMATKEGDDIRKRTSELAGTVRKSVGEGEVSGKEWDSITHITR
ncbi:hypothetical protein PTKIN_Ptkin06aG0097200 [Pterospermum kingtungense]